MVTIKCILYHHIKGIKIERRLQENILSRSVFVKGIKTIASQEVLFLNLVLLLLFII